MTIEERIIELAKTYRENLAEKIEARKIEMTEDNLDHYFLYNVLGITNEEGYEIDLFQNVGRFLYKYAGSFLEDAAKICFEEKFGIENAHREYVPNNIDNSPKRFEIDCLVEKTLGIELKWRDATTDGDHKNKEKNRVTSVSAAGYTPVRLMFYKPNRSQSIKIQKGIKEIYEELGGQYYAGTDAFDYVRETTGINLLSIIENISASSTKLL